LSGLPGTTVIAFMISPAAARQIGRNESASRNLPSLISGKAL
jgi:hypothetical protein